MDDQTVINQLKGLVIDGVNQAQSGHPGGALSSMDFAYILFTEFLKFDPDDPHWKGRDRFILSAGHESMLQYALLYAQGFLEKEELLRFRQLHSKTPGHPENHLTPGVECATGPLGQGCGMSVGMAIASSHMKAQLDAELFDHKTWVILGDGCMQEGVTLSSASIAGHLRLSNLIWYYDKNRIQISGKTDRAYSDDEAKVFAGFGWKVIEVDGHDRNAIRQAIESASSESERPTLIIGQTTIAQGAATLEGSHKTHGAPLPKDEYAATRERLGIGDKEAFYFDDQARAHFQKRYASLRDDVKAWNERFATLNKKSEFSSKWQKYYRAIDTSKLPAISWDSKKAMATRGSFGVIIDQWAKELPCLVGGSADLEPSNMTGAFAKQVGDFSASEHSGRNLAFGVREFPMGAISNGMALYGGLLPFDATFLVFSDYMRNAIRLGALQKAKVIHEFTHDSFYLGEDGPTHQPIEHLMSLRAVPDLNVMRPADSVETEAMMHAAIESKNPSCLCLSRQGLAYLETPRSALIPSAKRGAWQIMGPENGGDLVIFASGSEVHLALAVAKHFEANAKLGVRVVSVPCWELFYEQDKTYQDQIMARSCEKRVAIEAGVTLGWERFVGMSGLCIGIDHYGASAKSKDLETEFGFTTEQVIERVSRYLEGA